jgi:hypothetical protein
VVWVHKRGGSRTYRGLPALEQEGWVLSVGRPIICDYMYVRRR